MQTETNNEITIKSTQDPTVADIEPVQSPIVEIGGTNGLEPTRYGDWEKSGRCIDF